MLASHFEALAKAHSDDPSGSNGGVIGSFNPSVFGEYAAGVEQALSGLSVGQISQPCPNRIWLSYF